MSSLNPESRDALKSAIGTRIDELREEIKSLEQAARPVAPDDAIGRLTRMDAIVNKGVTEAGLNNARAQLQALRRALESADDEDFGECERCLKPIAVARLLVMPETTLCVTCAGAAEQTETS